MSDQLSSGKRLAHIVSILAAFLALGVALWLAGASVHIHTWRQQSVERVALFPAFFRLWLFSGASMCAAAAIVLLNYKRTEVLATVTYITSPLLALWLWTVPYLPAIPDEFPLILILTGPLRWVIGAATLLAVIVRALRRTALPSNLPAAGRGAIFVVSLAVYGVCGLRSYSLAAITGDEPHYLIITQSLLNDGDLRIENNHTRRDYRGYYAGELRPDSMRRGVNGEVYPNKSPGLPALLAPAYLAAGVRGAILVIASISALGALAVFDVAMLIGGRAVALGVWVGTCLTVPFVPHAWAIYPDPVAATIVALAVRWLLTSPPAALSIWLARGCWLALFPWLHTRMAVLCAGLTLCLLIRFRSEVRQCVALLTPIVLGVLAWLLYFELIYGTFDPRAPWAGTLSNISVANVPRGLLGLLFDQKFGLLVHSPVYALTAGGLVLLVRHRESRATAAMLVGTASLYVAASAQMYTWWGGSSAPARFLVPIVPLLAPFLAAFVRESRTVFSRALVASTLAYSLVLAAAGVIEPERRLLFSAPHGTSELFGVASGPIDLTSLLPMFTEVVWRPSVTTVLRWTAAALLSLTLIALVTRVRKTSVFTASVALVLAFLVAGSVLSARVSREERTQSEIRGRLALLDAFDPTRRVAFDYSRSARLAPAEWLQKTAVVLERPTAASDGTLGPRLALALGQYEATVWFAANPPEGDLQATLGRGQIVARAAAPLSNPARLIFDLPVDVPALWLQVTSPPAARQVLRAQITPQSLLPKSERPHIPARAVEIVQGHAGSFVMYLDDGTYPERSGTFWTRGVERGRIVLRALAARQLVLHLSTGPVAQDVRVMIGSDQHNVAVRASEEQSITYDRLAGMDWISIEVQATNAFRPADVDSRSFDRRLLGCRVRIELR